MARRRARDRRLPDGAVPVQALEARPSTGRVATLAMDVRGGRRPRARATSSSSTRYDLGVDIELYDADPAPALRASGSRRGRPHLRQGARLLRGRQHPHAEPVVPRLEGELLQVHQRDAQRHRGGHGGVAPDLARRGQRARARAAATSWRSPPTGSSWPTTAPPRWRCPRCRCSPCCRAPAGSPGWWTSASVRRDRADFFCTLEEGIKGQRAVEWRLVDEVVPRSRLEEAIKRARGRAGRAQRPPGRRARHRAAAARAAHRGRPHRLRARRPACWTARQRRRRDHGGAPRRRRPPADARGHPRRGRAASGRSRWPASSTT